MHEQINKDSGKFHWLFLGNSRSERPKHDSVIAETTNFVALPSLGSLVDGWVLVLPKFPVTRIADVSDSYQSEFENLVDHCVELVEAKFGAATLFEHGGYAGSKIACGVDQAHIHIVPLPFDLLQLAKAKSNSAPSFHKEHFLPYQVNHEGEYWYVSDQKQALIMDAVDGESQWFRKLIANATSQEDKWNYKKFPFHDRIDRTLATLRANG
jgi:diadenosine tetraphosphate (Ap4A) HIT family hydrolase